MKVTNKTSVQELKDFLNANFKGVESADKDLAENIAYAAQQMKKDPKSVKKVELAELARKVIKTLGDKVVEATTSAPKPVLAENSTKPKLTGAKTTDGSKRTKGAEPTPQSQPQAEPPKTENKPEPKKPAQQVVSSKDSLCKAVLENDNIVVTEFKQSFTLDGDTYERADDLAGLKEVREALEKGEEIYFAFYWTARHIKQYGYFGELLPYPKSFPQDVDLCSLVYASDEDKVAYAVSAYTEAFYTILPPMMEVLNGVRFSAGAEFQIYRRVATK